MNAEVSICWRLARLLTWPEVDPVEFNSHKPFRRLRLVWRQILKIFGMYGEFGKRKYWTIAIFLVMYIPPFGEDIPTLLGFTYYAAFKSGVEVYQTREQWLKENPGQEAELRKAFEDSRFDTDIKSFEGEKIGLKLKYFEIQLLDNKTKKPIAYYADVVSGYRQNPFLTGNWRGFKFWLELSTDPKSHKMNQFDQIEKQFIKIDTNASEGKE